MRKILEYIRAYRWSDILAMIRNNGREPKCCAESCSGDLVVITGATSGIGYHTARKYASMGANLLCINRSIEKSNALQQEIEGEFGVRCDYRIADLSRLSDIKNVGHELAQMETPIAVLIHNAGVYLTRREETSDGLEKVFVVHYLSSFILNYLLKEKLAAQQRARIIIVGSEGHRFAVWGVSVDDLNWLRRRYSGLKSYGSAKTAQLLSMTSFDELFRHSSVTINTMHPGAVKTETGQENGTSYRQFKKYILDKTLRSPLLSAEALYYLGVSSEVEGVSGKFFNLTTEERPAPPASDRLTARELWDKSMELAQLNESDKAL